MSYCFICGKEIISSAWMGLKLDVDTFKDRLAAEAEGNPYQIMVCTVQIERSDEAGYGRPVGTDCAEKARGRGYIEDPKRKPPKR